MKRLNLVILIISISLFFLVSVYPQHHVNSNVFTRTFAIKYEDKFGSGFTTEVDGKQYLITAKHIFPNNALIDFIEIYQDKKWKRVNVNPIICLDDSIYDVVAFAPNIQISKTLPLEISSDQIMLSQEVFFLGFPYFMKTDAEAINLGFPIAFVKKAILSAMNTIGKDIDIFFLDGVNNPGFSGGPVVFWDYSKKAFKVVGIVASYKYSLDTVYLQNSNREIEATDYRIKSNTGIVIAFGMNKIIEAIKNNPIGYQIK